MGYTISTEVIAQEVSGETVLLDLGSEQYFSLDVVGTRIWQMLGESKTPDEIKAQLLTEYDVAGDELERDIQSLIATLLDEGLLSAESSAG